MLQILRKQVRLRPSPPLLILYIYFKTELYGRFHVSFVIDVRGSSNTQVLLISFYIIFFIFNDCISTSATRPRVETMATNTFPFATVTSFLWVCLLPPHLLNISFYFTLNSFSWSADFADNGILSNNKYTHGLITDVNLHGFADSGWTGAVGDNVTLNRIKINGNSTQSSFSSPFLN